MKNIIFVILIILSILPTQSFAKQPKFYSDSILVVSDNSIIINKNSTKILPIASITKLLTAMVIIDGGQDLNELISITEEDVDIIKNSHSRINVNSKIHRYHLLYLMLMSSDNRAAHALAREYYCGINCFAIMMNSYSFLIGMDNSKFVEPSGLDRRNVSTAEDLVRLANYSKRYDLIKVITSTPFSSFYTKRDGEWFNNTNKFVNVWDVILSKTGYIKESGYCILMVLTINSKEYTIIMLNSISKKKRIRDLLAIEKFLKRTINVSNI